MSQTRSIGNIVNFLLIGLFMFQFGNVTSFLSPIFGASDPNGALATGASFLVFACVVFCVDRFIRRI